MFFLENRISLWEKYKDKYNFSFLKKEEIKNINEKIEKNILILPFPHEDENLEILKNFVKKEIFSEVLNLFYFIKREADFFEDKIFKYDLNPDEDILKITIYDFKLKEVKELKERVFTPTGIKEYLYFKGFNLKEICEIILMKK
ncbi:MAG: hypothetical protein H5U37_01970 [Caldisericia bacterium]|nr:hypothetical protein [Caldisericia bacterium]